jgi:phage tail sheath gpL-like
MVLGMMVDEMTAGETHPEAEVALLGEARTVALLGATTGIDGTVTETGTVIGTATGIAIEIVTETDATIEIVIARETDLAIGREETVQVERGAAVLRSQPPHQLPHLHLRGLLQFPNAEDLQNSTKLLLVTRE